MNNSVRQMSYHDSVPRREFDVARAIRSMTLALLFVLMVAVAILFPSDPTPGLFGSAKAHTTAAAPHRALPAV